VTLAQAIIAVGKAAGASDAIIGLALLNAGLDVFEAPQRLDYSVTPTPQHSGTAAPFDNGTEDPSYSGTALLDLMLGAPFVD
jgi:hypothetical protein